MQGAREPPREQQQQDEHQADLAAPATATPPPLASSSVATTTAELHACFGAPSEEEQQAQQLLSQSRRRLEAMRAGMPRSGKPATVGEYGAALRQCEQLVAALEVAVGEQQRQSGRNRLLRTQLVAAEWEVRWLLQPGAGGAATAAGPLRLQLLGPAGGAYPESSGAVVSVHALPPAEDWDAAWDARVQGLRTRDLLELHRQWLHACAVRLPRAQLLRGHPSGQQASRELEDLHARYGCFTLRAVRLAPEPWLECAEYDVDLMTPLAVAPSPEYVRACWHMVCPKATKQQVKIVQHYREVFAGLRREQQQLQQRYTDLTASHAFLAGGALPSGVYGGIDPAAAGLEAEELLKQMRSNLQQQELQVGNALHTSMHASPVERMATLRLALYPLALNGQMLLNVISGSASCEGSNC